MNCKINTLIIARIITASCFCQSTTNTLSCESYKEGNWSNYKSIVIAYNDACQVTESNDHYYGNHWDTPLCEQSAIKDDSGKINITSLHKGFYIVTIIATGNVFTTIPGLL